jgi:hypothetical protein
MGRRRGASPTKQGVNNSRGAGRIAIAFVSADDPAMNEDKNNRAFEIVDDDYLVRGRDAVASVVAANGGSARQ